MAILGDHPFIDLAFLILCLRVIYISISRGIIREGFKLAGIVLGSLFAFHYYSSLADKLNDTISFLNQEYLRLFSFLLVLLAIRLIFTFTGLITGFFFKRDEICLKERALLFFLGAFRVFLIGSIIFFALHLSPLDSKYFCHSISYRIVKNIGPKIYLSTFGIYNKFQPKVSVNKEVKKYYEAEDSLPGNSKKGH